jgi:hypothetical protein
MSLTMKERWGVAEDVASKLGVRKDEVFNVLTEILAKGLLPRIQADEPDAIEEARQLTAKHYPPQTTSRPKKRFAAPTTPVEKMAQDLRLMLWTIGKIGSVGRAEIAFKHAAAALREAELE